MSLPEYQLSFQLKLYDSIEKKDYETAKKFLEVQNWLDSNIRSILDESDAILHPKYQLVYTIGNQLPLDGGIRRWFVMQAILKRVPFHMNNLNKLHGNNCIEFDEKYKGNRSDIFTPCRLLKESIYPELKKEIIKDLFEEKLEIQLPEMNENTKLHIQEFLNQQSNTSFETFSMEFSKDVQNDILILNGLLQFDILKLMLVKRWRVNYGINKKGQRKMAVPFRAKDVAADRTEFGHNDVAIGFTQLSYYYSGWFKTFHLNKFFRNSSIFYTIFHYVLILFGRSY